MDKTRHWTLGCPGLLIFTDHKLLLGLIKQRDLEAVTPRPLRLMEKLLGWNFTIHHIAGKRDVIPDALFRFPWAEVAVMGPSSQEVEDAEKLEEAVLAEISSSMVSWPNAKLKQKPQSKPTKK